ncbi:MULTISPECIES: Uma2 family endonuclease [Deefgea]|uniref:Uma2 family endonuclease n=1 Tax=Deefgea chitinilytica TaxID=570276 RepID=A0ABS2CEH4_9NEIS|nr:MULTISPECIES: Uma2 family endonuclease [Deefgea]MBM5571791.1 Uma2 family endonuclease [Deefgea chitinilytica]MBM9889026.1 Uma2 family endonuclease [Deefgea sp. CFH1-16]
MALTQSDFVSPEQYLAEEELRQERHEYYDGLVYAMTGGTLAHNILAMNLLVRLMPHLQGSPCRAFINDVRLQIESADCYFYPDLLVHCAETAKSSSTVSSAKIVVEVLSPSTGSYDLGKKFDIYRQLDSLQEYVLIDSESKNVRVYRRAEHGDWVFHAYTCDETLRLASIDFSVSLTELYDDTGIEE